MTDFTKGCQVINLADIRRQKALAAAATQVQEEEAELIGTMNRQERFFWINSQFLMHRMAMDLQYGRISYRVGTIDDEPYVHFVSEAHEVYYPLQADMQIDFGREPLLVAMHQAHNTEGFPVVVVDNFVPEEL